MLTLFFVFVFFFLLFLMIRSRNFSFTVVFIRCRRFSNCCCCFIRTERGIGIDALLLLLLSPAPKEMLLLEPKLARMPVVVPLIISVVGSSCDCCASSCLHCNFVYVRLTTNTFAKKAHDNTTYSNRNLGILVFILLY